MAQGQGRPLLGRRQVLMAGIAAGVGLVAAACAAPAAPSWTFGPPSRPKEPGVPGASGGSSASAAPSASGDGLLIRIVAENFAFDLAEFTVPADTPFRIEFDHRDVRIPHNVAVYDSGPDGAPLFRGEIFSGPKVVTYEVPGLPRGTHYFTCDPHPPMNGLVKVA